MNSPTDANSYTAEQLRAKLMDVDWSGDAGYYLLPNWLRDELMGFLADRSTGPNGELEKRIVEAAMRRLDTWEASHPEGLLPPEHPHGIAKGDPARDLIEACMALRDVTTATGEKS